MRLLPLNELTAGEWVGVVIIVIVTLAVSITLAHWEVTVLGQLTWVGIAGCVGKLWGDALDRRIARRQRDRRL